MANAVQDPQQEDFEETSEDELENAPTKGPQENDQPNNNNSGSDTPASDVYDAGGSQPSPRQYGPEQLRQAEKKSVGQSTKTDAPQKDFYNPTNKEDSASSPSSTSTLPGNTNYNPKTERGFYKPPQSPTSSSTRLGGVNNFLFGTTRRRVIVGATGVATVGSAVFFISFFTGPFQFVHLAQILGRNFSGSENTASIRTKGLFRYARTKDIGETRVGLLGSRTFSKTITQLKNAGIEFDRNNFTGAPKAMTIDPSVNPDYKGLSNAQIKTAIIKDYNISNEKIVSFKDGKYTIDLNSTSLKGISFTKATAKTAVGSLDNGKITTAMEFRVVTKFFNLPNLFSPIEKVTKAKENQLGEVAAKKAEAKRQEALKQAETPEITDAKTKVKGILKGNQGKITVFLTGTTGLCLLKQSANDAVKVNRAAIVVPATVKTVDKIAIGSKVQSGQNLDASDLGPVADSFKDSNGKTIWDAKALNVTAGTTEATGPDIPSDYAQAFSSKTTADNLRSAINSNIPLAGVACSQLGLIVQGVANFGLLISGVFDAGTSWAVIAAQRAANVAATAGVMYMFQQHLTNLLEDKAAIPDALSGPLGGNIMAYAAREAGNIGARASGGIELANSSTTTLGQAEQAKEDKEYQALGMSKKIFDVYDYRSVASRLIDKSSPSPSKNITSVASVFTNFGSFFSNSFSTLYPKAKAASEPYNWDFPRYGIPDDIAQNPGYEDPYTNAETVANMLDANSGYIDRAQKCFGVDITKINDKWTVVANKDVTPGGDEYRSGNCNENSDSWHRLMLFVFDSRLMDAISCYQGDDDACTNLDINSSQAPAAISQTSKAPGTYLNPLRDVQKNGSLVAKRVDQGVDYGGSGPVYPIGNGQILNLTNDGWPGGTFIVYKLLDGPAQGKFVFFAENCKLSPTLKINQTVDTNTVLCTMVNASPHIETGWADGGALGYALAHNSWGSSVDDEAHYTAYGQNFSDLLQSLGAPSGTIQKGAIKLGSLPEGWPTW